MTPRGPAVTTLLSIGIVCGLAAQDVPRRLEPAECPFADQAWTASAHIECRWLVVPQDRSRTTGPTVRLFVVVVRADSPGGTPPLVMLHGGPGASALLPLVRWGVSQRSSQRDFVIYDQRGAGLSEPDPCPEYSDRLEQVSAGEPVPLGGSGRSSLETVARDCAGSMRSRGIEPAAFGTAANVADLVDLRLALGYEHWDIYGTSYGARLAQAAMRRDRQGIRAVVLDKPLPPDAEAEAALASQQALARIFDACASNAACNTRFPNLEQTFIAVFDSLSRAPLTAPAAEGSTRPIRLDGGGFVTTIRRLMRSRVGLTWLPLLLHELNTGDRLRAARQLLRSDASGRPSRAVFWLAMCFDDYGPGYLARLDTVRSIVWRPLQNLRDNLEECAIWQTRFAADEERSPVVSDIPTLIMSGEFDGRAPVEFGQRIASTLSRAWLIVVPGETHGGPLAGCRATLLLRFIEDPGRRPEAACIGSAPPIEFRTGWPD
jgi:pimeloyl-ACP methyl ester carboxylesterase